MDINAPILLHHLKNYFQVEYARCGMENKVRTPILYSSFFETDHHIVLVHFTDLRKCLDHTRHSVVICMDSERTAETGRFFTSVDLHTNDLIVLDDSLAETMAFNILNHILDQYNLWENSMNEILHNSHSFLDMINAVSDLMELPVALTDTNFRYIAYSDSSTDLMNFVDGNNQVTIDVTNHFLADPQFQQLENNRDAFVYTATKTAVYKNIFNHDNYVGRLACVLPESALENESANELQDYYKSVFNRAASFIEILYAQSDSFENTAVKFQQIHICVTKILNREYVNIRELELLLAEQDCLSGDSYRVFCLMLQDTRQTFYSPNYLCNQIEHLLPGSFAIWNTNKIIVLCDVSQYLRRLKEPLDSCLGRFLKQMKIIAGSSRNFHNFSSVQDIYTAWTQAEFALGHGLRQERRERLAAGGGNEARSGGVSAAAGNGSRQGSRSAAAGNDSRPDSHSAAAGSGSRPDSRFTIRVFDDYALDYILEKGTSGLKAEQICHPALLSLNEHDEKHSTFFIRTLKAYVNSGYNAAATARALYIHRSSFLGRLERIQELVTIDLEDPEERLYLEISLRLFFS